MIRALSISFALALVTATSASELTLPAGAQLLSDRPSTMARYALPTGAADRDIVPVRYFEGLVLRRTWRVGGDATSLQLFAPIREQLQSAGYEVQYQCQSQDCGGFSFRFGVEVVPAPDMMVNIADFQFLSATKEEDHAVSLLVSRSGRSTYIQIIEVAPPSAELFQFAPSVSPTVEITPEQQVQDADTSLMGALTIRGRVVLDDLEFETGSSRLGAGPFDSLAELAAALVDDAEMRILLVGHTDNTGALDKNISLSLQRAEAVRDRLRDRFEIEVAQIEVAGAGYMLPVTSNQTSHGREANRRVEAVLLSN